MLQTSKQASKQAVNAAKFKLCCLSDARYKSIATTQNSFATRARLTGPNFEALGCQGNQESRSRVQAHSRFESFPLPLLFSLSTFPIPIPLQMLAQILALVRVAPNVEIKMPRIEQTERAETFNRRTGAIGSSRCRKAQIWVTLENQSDIWSWPRLKLLLLPPLLHEKCVYIGPRHKFAFVLNA